MEYKIKYPQFKGRRYGVTLYHDNSKTIIPPESFFIGNILATPPIDLKHRLKRWLEYEKNLKDFEKLFDVSKKYRLKLREDSNILERIRRLAQLNPRELEFALSQKIRSQEGSYSLLRIGGKEAFDIDISKGDTSGVYAGNIVLVGYVKSKGDARKAQQTRFKHVSITGPFKQSKSKIIDVSCSCEDSRYARDKQGYENVRLVCTHAGALLYFSHESPELVKRFKHVKELIKDADIFTPFHSIKPQEKPDIKLEWLIDGEQPSLDYLTIDVVLSRYFNRESLFEIGKKLTKIPVIYDKSLEALILDERAGFEVLVDSYVLDTSKPINPAVRTLFNLIRHHLESRNYKMAGYCLEKKDSEYETAALIFRRDKDEVRLLFNKNFPPVAIVRKNINSVVNLHKYIDTDTHLHPFSELFTPKVMYDDRSRKETNYEVIIPSEFTIPISLWSDYKIAIEKYFPRNIEGFKEQIYRRNLKNKSNLLAMIS